ncbi:hypothetical protein C8R45DRAFT_1002010 [Mycena sanguinolenta]|nr:hypothetical protein C8R45DRAFT_1002010 [Mycena sanguinolenta]
MQYATGMANEIGGPIPIHVLQAIQYAWKPAPFIHRHVRNLYLATLFRRNGRTRRQDTNVLKHILSACCGVYNLVLLFDSHSLQSLLPTLAGVKPRRLTLIREPPLAADALIFTSLTHFRLLGVPLMDLTPACPLPSFLAQLPVLTHFAMGVLELHPAVVAQAKAILVQCKTLQVLVLVTRADLTLFPSIDSDDPRLVLYQRAGNKSFVRGWVAETRGGIDFWARADAFLAKKRRGEIPPASRYWIDVGDGIPSEGGT